MVVVSNISKIVDFHLQPIVKLIPSYVRDTKDFLNNIKNRDNLPKDTYLVTLDVKSLYTNIPKSEGITAVKRSLERHLKRTVDTKVITTFLELILTLTNFIFNGKNYVQVKGCAMGSICAPSYPNKFMAEFEKRYIYPYITNKVKVFLRYIDDIFIIWTGNLT